MTIPLLDLLIFHWIQGIQWKSFRENSIIKHLFQQRKTHVFAAGMHFFWKLSTKKFKPQTLRWWASFDLYYYIFLLISQANQVPGYLKKPQQSWNERAYSLIEKSQVMSIEWNSIRLDDPAHWIVTKLYTKLCQGVKGWEGWARSGRVEWDF